MDRSARSWLGRSLVAAAAAVATGCAGDTPLGPDRDAATTQLAATTRDRGADLGACDNLRAPAGSTLAFRAYARGVQIYRWSGTSWVFVAPSAVLSADAVGKSTVGIHYAGPTWESNSGSKVVGTVISRCTPNPDAIPWLALGAVSAEGPGVFRRVTFIQRVNTEGGKAPAAGGSFVGEIANVPYTAVYLFYRAP